MHILPEEARPDMPNAAANPSRAGTSGDGVGPAPRISARRALIWLMATTVALNVVSLVIRHLNNLKIPGTYNLNRLLDLNGESNIPAWYSSSLWFIAALLLGAIAVSKHRASAPFVAHWFGLCAVCVFLSIDEAAMIHEAIGNVLHNEVFDRWSFLDVDGGWIYSWMYFGIAFVFVFLLVYWRFLRHLPPRIMRLMITSGAIFLFGAMGLESISAAAEHNNIVIATANLWTILIAAEEFFEMVGVVLFIYSLLAYMCTERLQIELAVSD